MSEDKRVVPKANPDMTLDLTEDGIEMPPTLKGYAGSFTIRTGAVTGEYQTTESGLPETDYYDGVFAVYPDEDGSYNPDLGPGLMAISTDDHPESVYQIEDKRTDGGDE